MRAFDIVLLCIALAAGVCLAIMMVIQWVLVRNLNAKISKLRELLKRHHDIHLNTGKVTFAPEPGMPEGIEIDLSAEYCDSELYKETVEALG